MPINKNTASLPADSDVRDRRRPPLPETAGDASRRQRYSVAGTCSSYPQLPQA